MSIRPENWQTLAASIRSIAKDFPSDLADAVCQGRATSAQLDEVVQGMRRIAAQTYNGMQRAAALSVVETIGNYRCALEDSLLEAREAAAEAYYQGHDFGDGVEVEDSDGWEHPTPGDEWSCNVYVYPFGDDRDATKKLGFTVRFEVGTAQVAEAYAIDSKGRIWGSQMKAASTAACDDCEAEVEEVVGAPDGAEVCRDCFERGGH